MVTEERKPFVLEPMSDAEIHELARRIVKREIFITNSEDGIRCAFGLIMALWTDLREEDAEQIGALYEEISKAGPRSMNGYPMFTSVQLAHRDDLPKIQAEVARMEAALA